MFESMQDRRRAARLLAVLGVLFFGLAGCASLRDSLTNGFGGGRDSRSVVLDSGWQLQDIAKASQPGEAISRIGFATGGWYAATVPGTVLTSLVNDGVYPEPLYGENNRPDKIPESLSRTSYWYRTEFTAPDEPAGGHAWLDFEGINYIAEVWVNGSNLGEIKGAFARGTFDITHLVKPGEKAALAVKIIPPPHPADPPEQTLAAGTGRNGGDLTQDGPTFLSSQGWDWIPAIRDRNIGIWQNVKLSATGPVTLNDPLVSSDLPLPRTDSADLTIEAALQNISDAPQSGILRGSFAGAAFAVPATLAPKETKLIKLTPATAPQLHVVNPKLWWPNGYGDPNLYDLQLSFEIGGSISDSRELSFGIREINYQTPDSENLTIVVNGVPIMCKGGNWGMDEAMKRNPRERLEAQVRMHRLANFNMIRNWVGQSTSEDFYDLCDRNGIMIWDEFFQPNPSDGANPNDNAMYLANVREKVIRFRNHPSIALWCGRNEGDPPPAIDAGIRKIMAELEPSRLYQANSRDGRGVRSGGPYAWRPPRMYYNFNAAEAFKTELGSVSIPTLEAIHAMMPEKDWETINDDWAEHDLLRGAQQGDRYPATLAQRYGPLANLPDFARKGQLANYEAYRALYEGRNAKLFKPSTGVLTWMSNPSQPSFVWQIYSYDLEPLSSLFAARKACEPIHIQMNQSDFHAMAINNTPRPLENLEARARVFNLDGTLKKETKIPVSAKPSEAVDLGAIDFPADLSPVHFIQLELKDAAGKLISDNFYWRAAPDRQDDFADLAKMPVARLKADISRSDENGTCKLVVAIQNPSENIALMAHLQLRRDRSKARVLPVYYDDNYISLLPGESKTVAIEAASKNLAGENPLVMLDGWNVAIDAASFPGGTSIALNPEAQIDSVPMDGLKYSPPAPGRAR